MTYPKSDNTITLIESFKGYYNITLIEETIPGRRVEICGSGEVREVRHDEFKLD